jgi:hypothetical protein
MEDNRHVELLFPSGAPAINGCGEAEAPRRLAPAIPEFEPEPDYPDLLQAPRNTPADYMLRHQAGRAAARHERAQA